MGVLIDRDVAVPIDLAIPIFARKLIDVEPSPPPDAASQAERAVWYGMQGASDWAAELLEAAAAGGQRRPLALARAYWSEGRRAAAVAQFEAAARGSADADEAAYLRICARSVQLPAWPGEANRQKPTAPCQNRRRG